MKNIIGPIPVWLLLCLFGISHATERVCSPALPDIASKLSVTENLAQLSSSVYFIGFALGIFALGRLSDLIGRRPLVLIGIGLYALASIACSFATGPYTLLICRFAQAFGVSVGSVLAQAMARDSFEGKALANVYIGVAISLAFIPSVGLILGGFFVQYIGWTANFRLLGTLGIVLFFLCFYYLPETNRHIANARNFSYFNIFLKVIRDQKVVLYALIVGCVSGMTFGFYVEAPFIFIEFLKLSPSEYGMLGCGIAAANLAGGMINRYLVKHHFSSNIIITYGICLILIASSIMFLGSFFLTGESRTMAMLIVMVPTMLHAMGHTFTVPHILHFALEDYREVSGSAGSIFGSLYYAIIAIVNYAIATVHGYGIATFTTLFLGLSITTVVAFLMIRMLGVANATR